MQKENGKINCRKKIKEFLIFFNEYVEDYFSGQKWKHVKQQKTR